MPQPFVSALPCEGMGQRLMQRLNSPPVQRTAGASAAWENSDWSTLSNTPLWEPRVRLLQPRDISSNLRSFFGSSRRPLPPLRNRKDGKKICSSVSVSLQEMRGTDKDSERCSKISAGKKTKPAFFLFPHEQLHPCAIFSVALTH